MRDQQLYESPIIDMLMSIVIADFCYPEWGYLVYVLQSGIEKLLIKLGIEPTSFYPSCHSVIPYFLPSPSYTINCILPSLRHLLLHCHGLLHKHILIVKCTPHQNFWVTLDAPPFLLLIFLPAFWVVQCSNPLGSHKLNCYI